MSCHWRSAKAEFPVTLLNAVIDYLPDPTEVENIVLDLDSDEAEIILSSDPEARILVCFLPLTFCALDNRTIYLA